MKRQKKKQQPLANGDLIEKLMEVHNIDRKDLVKKADVSSGSVHNALTSQPMYKSTLTKIADALYTTMEAITIKEKEDKPLITLVSEVPDTELNSTGIILTKDEINIQPLTLFPTIDDQDKEILRKAAIIINKILNETTA